MELRREAKAMEKVKKILPTYRVEGLLNVKLEKERRFFPSVKPSRIVPHEQEIIVNASRFDESALGYGDMVFHVRGESSGKNLGHNLGNPMDESNGPIIGDLFRTIFFRDEDNVCGVEPMKIGGLEIREPVHNRHDVGFDDIPTRGKELAAKPFRARGLARRQGRNSQLHPVLRERSIQDLKITSGEV